MTNQWYIDYCVGVWRAEPTIRYRIQIVSCASVKITLNNGISALVNKYHKISEAGEIQCL